MPIDPSFLDRTPLFQRVFDSCLNGEFNRLTVLRDAGGNLDAVGDASYLIDGLKANILMIACYYAEDWAIDWLLEEQVYLGPVQVGNTLYLIPPLFMAMHSYAADLADGEPTGRSKEVVDRLLSAWPLLGHRFRYKDVYSGRQEVVTESGWELAHRLNLSIKPDRSVLDEGHLVPLPFGWQLSGERL